MASKQLRGVLQSLHQAALPQEAAVGDGQLLERFLRDRDESALAALVRRHGPMVWGVCRRLLDSHHDVEDAFQATFLVLVRKAASVIHREKVANWLYGVAHQTALKARATAARRRSREKQVKDMPEPASPPRPHRDDLRPILDQELSRLPDKYRTVLVLCDLEGKTRKEAARQLGVPEGTVASRQVTARTMLARRLARHGLALSTPALVVALSEDLASASVPPAVTTAAVKAASHFAVGLAAAPGVLSPAAVALAEGVLRTMLLNKLRMIAPAVVLAIAVAAGVAGVLGQEQPGTKTAPVAPPPVEKPVARRANANNQPAAPQAPQQQAPAPRPERVQGVVKAVDLDRNTVTVAGPEGVATFAVAPGAKVDIDCQLGTLTGLPPGANVTLSQFVDATTAGAVSANGSSIFSSVKAVDAAKKTITVAGQPDDRTFTIRADTAIHIDGKPGTLEAIPVGASLHALNLRVDQQTVLSINVEGPSLHHVGVKAVDSAQGTITFDDKAPPDVAGKTLVVAAGADVHVDGLRGKLAGLPAGCFVNVVLTVDRLTIRRLDAEGPIVGGCGGSEVSAVDASKRTITFSNKGSPDAAGKTFAVAANAGVLIDGKPGTLAEVPSGSYVMLALRVDGQTAHHVNAQGPPAPCDCGGSLVKAVDAANRTITFDDKARAEVAGKTYSVAANALVLIDGRPGTLADVPAGVYVDLGLAVDRLTATRVLAQGPVVSGTLVKAVDAGKSTVTIDDKTYSVAKGVNLLIDGQPGKLAALPTGARVAHVRLCVDQRTVAILFVATK
jgi:RNA polymerase sigma factor (sigma-70 family)